MTRTWFAQTFFISSVSVAPCYPLVCENPFKYKHKCKQIDHWFKQITFIFTIFGVIWFYLQSTLSVENKTVLIWISKRNFELKKVTIQRKPLSSRIQKAKQTMMFLLIKKVSVNTAQSQFNETSSTAS